MFKSHSGFSCVKDDMQTALNRHRLWRQCSSLYGLTMCMQCKYSITYCICQEGSVRVPFGKKKYPKGSLELNEWSHYTEEFVIIYNADMSQCITSFL